MHFYLRPFVYLTLLLIFGVLVGDKANLGLVFIETVLFCCLSTYLMLERFGSFNNLKVGVLFIGVFFLGNLLTTSDKRVFDFSGAENSVVVDVKEISSKDKLWRKAICETSFKVDSSLVKPYHEKLVLFFRSEEVRAGDVLLVHSKLSEIANKNNPGEFDAKSFWSSKGIYRIGFVTEEDYKIVSHKDVGWVKMKFKNLREYLSNVLAKHLKGDELALAKALILGDKDLLTSELRAGFSSAGAMHVLAVSGLHVGIVLYVLFFILQKFPRIFSRNKALFISILFIWVYAGVTGFSPSVLRATLMFTILSLGKLIGKSSNSFNLLFLSAFTLLCWKPMLVFDIGFQLSYMAMLGIFILYPFLSTFFYIKRSWLRWLWNGTSVGIAAQLFTVPLTLYYFHQFPNYFAVTNIGVMLLAGALLGIGFALFVFHALPLAGFAVGVILSVGFFVLLQFIQFVAGITGSVAYGFTISGEIVVFVYLLIVILILFSKVRIIKRMVFFGLIVVLVVVQFNRYENMVSNELVIFNYKKPVVAVKKGNVILCFSNSIGEEDRQLKNILEAYAKVKPGKVIYNELPIGVSKVDFQRDSVFITRTNDAVKIVFAKMERIIRLNHKIQFGPDDSIIDMPYLNSGDTRVNLGQGAVVFKL